VVFASLTFLFVFFPVFLLLYVSTPVRGKNTVLLLSSWVFYGWWSPRYLLLLVALIALAWAGGLMLTPHAPRNRRVFWILPLLIVFYTAVLAGFKYANIVAGTLNGFVIAHGAMPFAWQHVVLPIGLSFTVLQVISYFVDIHRGRFPAERNPVAFATYLSLFGHLVAGPIIRYDWVRNRLAHRPMRWRAFRAGARRFMVGLAMKVLVADTLAPVVDHVFTAVHPSLIDAWLGCLGYTLQLYFDFAGYSAMAIGIGAMLGFRFPENFQAPYLARDLSDFWRRWHISLSSWLRDYLYIPLGGSRAGTVRTLINLMVTMAIGGLWHGADSWNFLYWGIVHGAGLGVVHLWKQRRRGHHADADGRSLPAPLAHALTLAFVMLAWTLFRSPTPAVAIDMLAGQMGAHALGLGSTLSNLLRLPVVLAYLLGLIWVVMPAVAGAFRRRSRPDPTSAAPEHPSNERLMQTGAPRPPLTHMLACARTTGTIAAFVLSVLLIASRGTVPFLYFQF
jgi:alginate O-acetyltransferase complex protein AlgI